MRIWRRYSHRTIGEHDGLVAGLVLARCDRNSSRIASRLARLVRYLPTSRLTVNRTSDMPTTTAAGSLTTQQQILNTAERLVQMHGFNGFSYADIAQEVGITKASLHYHFSTKAELGRSLIGRYHQNFFAALNAIDEDADAADKLRQYTHLYAQVLKEKRMCLCGMLAAEFVTLPKGMKEGVKRFFDANERWLAHVLESGRKVKQLTFDASATEVARTVIGSLEGAMLVARSYGSTARFLATTDWLLAELGVGVASAKAKRH